MMMNILSKKKKNILDVKSMARWVSTYWDKSKEVYWGKTKIIQRHKAKKVKSKFNNYV